MASTTDELRADIERRRARMSDTVEEIGEHVRPRRIVDRRTRAVRSWAGDVRVRVMGRADDVSSTMSDTASQAGERAQQAGQQIAEVPVTVARQTRGAPLVAGAIAFGVGALVALVLPETEPEQRTLDALQPQLDSAAAAARDAGRHTAEALKPTMQQAAGELEQEVADRATALGDEVKRAGRSVADEARRT
jgi:hypothetical protein